jgi:hypothetical protein
VAPETLVDYRDRGRTDLDYLHYCLPRGVPSRVRGHCQQTAWLALPLRAFSALGEGQEPESTRREREAEEDWGRWSHR